MKPEFILPDDIAEALESASKSTDSYPEGALFFALADLQSGRCVATVNAWLGTSGRVLELHRTVGTLLSLLYRAATCHWTCRGGDHLAERLAGRAVNTSLSAYALLRQGSYDESLNLTRSVGELGNLLALFAYDATSLEAWRTADRKARKNGFSPVHVRKRLEDLGASAYVSRDRYSQLCEVATHAWPGLNPQGYTGDGTPRIGGVLQEVGAELTLNEIAIATSVTALYVARLLDLEADIRARFEHLAIKTITLLSDVQITNMPVVWERIDRARRETRSPDSHSG